MKTFENPLVRLHQGDSRHLPLEDGTVSCVVTSPPYLGLRKYKGEQELVWAPPEGCLRCGGSALVSTWMDDAVSGDCPCCVKGEHEWGDEQVVRRGHPGDQSTLAGTQTAAIPKAVDNQGTFCTLCDAWRGAFGLEPTPALYIQHLMLFLDEIWRVLRDDGVVFLNIGDSYAGSGGAHKAHHANPGLSKSASRNGVPAHLDFGRLRVPAIRPKSLMLVPERFAIACQERGWIVRDRIAWAKLNPMPESVTDRPTNAWEHIWMLTKSERVWWDQEAAREPAVYPDDRRKPYAPGQVDARGNGHDRRGGEKDYIKGTGRNLRNVWTLATQPFGWEMCEHCGMIYDNRQFARLPSIEYGVEDEETGEVDVLTAKLCKRCRHHEDWLSHFATFPEALVEICLLAACPTAICTVCEKPRERIVEKGEYQEHPDRQGRSVRNVADFDGTDYAERSNGLGLVREATTTGWTDCGHGSYQPGLVLDPFGGSMTTAVVAQKLGRRAVCVDLSEFYIRLGMKRLEAIPLPMALEV